MAWKDGDSPPLRAVYAGMRGSLRLRSIAHGVRGISPLTVAAIVLAFFSLALHSWILFVGMLLGLALTAWQWLYFRHRLAGVDLESTDEMTGWEFEKWLGQLFDDLGFRVERTPYRGDFGADFVLTWNGMRIAVQAKRTSRAVGVRAVQEVVAARSFYGCERAMVVTNSYFTEQALVLARANGVWMRTRDDLARGLVRAGRRGAPVGVAYGCLASHTAQR
jgi:Restriction endonuclease